MAANPEAIAWYVQRSEALLDDLRGRVHTLRIRGGQLAGFSGAVLALAGANIDAVLSGLHGAARDCAGIALSVGLLMLIAALAQALRGTRLPRLLSDISAEEVANYTSPRLIGEPELWRVQVRTIRGLLVSIESTTRQGDEAARTVRKAEYLFLFGLLSVGIALAIVIVVTIL